MAVLGATMPADPAQRFGYDNCRSRAFAAPDVAIVAIMDKSESSSRRRTRAWHFYSLYGAKQPDPSGPPQVPPTEIWYDAEIELFREQ